MHFSIYARLLDLLWEHLDDEDRFRRLAHEAVERYIAYMRGKMDERKKYSYTLGSCKHLCFYYSVSCLPYRSAW